MVPFMYYDLKDIVYQLLEIIVKPAALDSFKAKPRTWKDIDLFKKITIWSVLESWILCLPSVFLTQIISRRQKNADVKVV